jgi:acyl dehydratase
MENIKNATFDEIRVGASAEFRRLLSQADIELLALVSGDVDPFHLTGEGATSVRPDARSTEAVAAQAVIAAALGTRLPGPGMAILCQNLRFQGMITAGDELTATVKVAQKREAPDILLDCRCTNQRGKPWRRGRSRWRHRPGPSHTRRWHHPGSSYAAVMGSRLSSGPARPFRR